MLLIYWAIAIVLVLLIFAFVKIKYIKHKLSWIIVILLILFFYVGFIASTFGKDLDLNSTEGLKSAVKIYLSWMGNAFGNVKSITGEAIKKDWQTNITSIK